MPRQQDKSDQEVLIARQRLIEPLQQLSRAPSAPQRRYSAMISAPPRVRQLGLRRMHENTKSCPSYNIGGVCAEVSPNFGDGRGQAAVV